MNAGQYTEGLLREMISKKIKVQKSCGRVVHWNLTCGSSNSCQLLTRCADFDKGVYNSTKDELCLAAKSACSLEFICMNGWLLSQSYSMSVCGSSSSSTFSCPQLERHTLLIRHDWQSIEMNNKHLQDYNKSNNNNNNENNESNSNDKSLKFQTWFCSSKDFFVLTWCAPCWVSFAI